jgi:Reverse transcriptase (RNA-dependent DNA polymerase)
MREAMQRSDSNKWQAAALSEHNSLQKAGTYSLVQLLRHRRAIGSKWVFRTKRGADGSIIKYKARLVSKGDAQK